MRNTINIEIIKKCIDKLKMYDRDENICFSNIFRSLSTINNCYISNNTNGLLQVQNQLNDKFSIIKNNHYNNEVILINNLNDYINTSRKVSNSFDNINW